MREAHPIAGVDTAGLREVLSRGNLKRHEASDRREVLALLLDESAPLLFCKRDNSDGNRKNVLNITTSLPAPPSLIVFCRLASKYRSAKVLDPGGFDGLMAPLEPEGMLGIASLPGAAGSPALLRAPIGRRKQRTVGECPDFRTNGKGMK
jgi:hypothetical protein